MDYKYFFNFTFIVFFLLISLIGCSPDPENEPDSLNLEILISEIIDKVRQDYVEDTSQEKLVEGALNGLLSNLDAYSGYLNADDYKNLSNRTKGEFAGLGVEIIATKGILKVIAAIDDTPAHKAGIKEGDVITHINNQEVHKLSNQEALHRLQGSPGTEIALTITRSESEPFVVKLKRAIIEINPVRYTIKDNVAYIRLSFFSENTSTKLTEALSSLKKNNPKMQGLVLDLRNNPGGTLEQAVAVASLFLGSNLIVDIRSRNSSYNQKLHGKGGDSIKGIPMVVLINKGTASASEIVAGALRDHKRAIIMGARSFGKGSIQSLFSIPGHGGIRLTTARFYTPKGQAIQDQGIEPDITIENHQSKEDSKVPHSPARLNLSEKQDYQLQRAIDLLRGLSVFQKSS
jgi:carboxyl-terminal processing protease